jgi:hypothetical protein
VSFSENRKQVLETEDLKKAATFRGGSLLQEDWNGDMHFKLDWQCCMGHSFEMTPHAVLKGGHWCPHCLTPPWNYPDIAQKNRFVGQLFPVKP